MDAEAVQGHVVFVDPLVGVTREEQVVGPLGDHGSQQHPVRRTQVLCLVHDDVPVPGLAGGGELLLQPCRVRGDALERPQVRLVQSLGELLDEFPDDRALRSVELPASPGAAGTEVLLPGGDRVPEHHLGPLVVQELGVPAGLAEL